MDHTSRKQTADSPRGYKVVMLKGRFNYTNTSLEKKLWMHVLRGNFCLLLLITVSENEGRHKGSTILDLIMISAGGQTGSCGENDCVVLDFFILRHEQAISDWLTAFQSSRKP